MGIGSASAAVVLNAANGGRRVGGRAPSRQSGPIGAAAQESHGRRGTVRCGLRNAPTAQPPAARRRFPAGGRRSAGGVPAGPPAGGGRAAGGARPVGGEAPAAPAARSLASRPWTLASGWWPTATTRWWRRSPGGRSGSRATPASAISTAWTSWSRPARRCSTWAAERPAHCRPAGQRYRVTGVDISPGQIAAARAQRARRDVHRRGHVRVGAAGGKLLGGRRAVLDHPRPARGACPAASPDRRLAAAGRRAGGGAGVGAERRSRRRGWTAGRCSSPASPRPPRCNCCRKPASSWSRPSG